MGAFLQFKRETGKEVTEMADSLSEQVVFLYCCIASAARADKKPFAYTLEEFADHISLEDMQQWQSATQTEETGNGAKKNSK